VRAAPENLAAIRGLAEIHNRRRDAGFRNTTDTAASAPVAPTAPPSEAAPGFASAAPVDFASNLLTTPRQQPAIDSTTEAQVHALEAFLHAVERARTDAQPAL
jgi:hypothetical protein